MLGQSHWGKRMYKMLGLRYFIMLCNNAEYKKMGQVLVSCTMYRTK
jgi:hypothetical protein